MKLIADSIRISYNDRIVLSDIFLSCEVGEIIGLIGRNGSGKSTLLKVINRTTLPTDSFVRVGDEAILSAKDAHDHSIYTTRILSTKRRES